MQEIEMSEGDKGDQFNELIRKISENKNCIDAILANSLFLQDKGEVIEKLVCKIKPTDFTQTNKQLNELQKKNRI